MSSSPKHKQPKGLRWKVGDDVSFTLPLVYGSIQKPDTKTRRRGHIVAVVDAIGACLIADIVTGVVFSCASGNIKNYELADIPEKISTEDVRKHAKELLRPGQQLELTDDHGDVETPNPTYSR